MNEYHCATSIVDGGFVREGEVAEVAEEEQNTRELLQDRPVPRQLPGHPLIVRVKKGHEVAARCPDTSIARGAWPTMLTAEESHWGPEGTHHSSCIVCRAVVNNDDLVSRLTLGQRGPNRAFDEARPIVCRNHYGHREACRHHSRLPPHFAAVRHRRTHPWYRICSPRSCMGRRS